MISLSLWERAGVRVSPPFKETPECLTNST